MFAEKIHLERYIISLIDSIICGLSIVDILRNKLVEIEAEHTHLETSLECTL